MYICVAIFIILESQSEKSWDQNYKLRPQNYKLRPQNYKLRSQNYKLRSQNYKLRPQNYKLRSQNYKLRPQNYKLRVQNLQVWQLKLISYNFLKRCFECTVNGSLQMVVAFWKHERWLVESSKEPYFYNSMETRNILRELRGFHGNFEIKNTK